MSNIRRRPWHTRRRTRSVGSLPCVWKPMQLHIQTQSDEMCSSSTSKDKDCPTYYQSDSDDICSSARNEIPCGVLNMSSVCANIPNMESDSFNENSPCRRSTRRKRKFKRIAMEVELSNNSRFFTQPHCAAQSYTKKKRIMRHALNCQSGGVWLNTGKRKRSAREKLKVPLDGGDSSDLGRDSKVLTLSKLSLDDYPEEQFNTMEVSYTVAGVSSSSISSSGSETEIYTNDEGREEAFRGAWLLMDGPSGSGSSKGRLLDMGLSEERVAQAEGDDEQSDWIGDVGLATGGTFNQGDHGDVNYSTYQNYLVGNFENAPSEDKKSGKLFAERGRDTDVRITRRRGRSFKPNFSYPLATEIKTFKHIPSFLDSTLSKKNDMDVESGTVARRHTFSGYKKRKRIPTHSTIATDTISDKALQLFLPAIHKLSDISSSDSKDSLQ